jgi:hypothetical protein
MDSTNKSNKPSIHEDILNKLCAYITKGSEYGLPGSSEAEEKYKSIMSKMKQVSEIQTILHSVEWK